MIVIFRSVVFLIIFVPVISLNSSFEFTSKPITIFEINMYPKIINGELATTEDSKHMVSIRSKEIEYKNYGTGHQCGGSLISRKVVVTAAHCFIMRIVSPPQIQNEPGIIVVMGNLNLLNATNTFQSDVKLIINKKFSLNTMFNDIALLILKNAVPNYFANIAPINLTDELPAPGTICHTYGWGATKYLGKINSDLMTLTIPLLSYEDCSLNNKGNILDGMICAGKMDGGKDACQGDSGGPLVCDNALVGIVSWGRKCALPGYPGIYTSIMSYKNWIENNNADLNIAKFDDTSFYALIQNIYEDDEVYGGVLFNSRKKSFVITAAKNFYWNGFLKNPKQFKVTFGVNEKRSRAIGVDAIIINKEYNFINGSHNIALLLLNETITLWAHGIIPVKLATKFQQFYKNCITLGFNYYKVFDFYQNKYIALGDTNLHYANVMAYGLKLCNPRFANRLQCDWICAGDMDEIQNENQPELGGPLLCDNTLVGVLIKRSKIGLIGYPSIYTYVQHHINWILKTTAMF